MVYENAECVIKCRGVVNVQSNDSIDLAGLKQLRDVAHRHGVARLGSLRANARYGMIAIVRAAPTFLSPKSRNTSEPAFTTKH